jgi:heat shock protein HtpX
VAGEIGQKALAAAREQSLQESDGDVFDTHPPLRERLQALEGCRPGDVVGADPLAITLLADPQALERAVIAPALPPTDGPLPPIQWSEVGERVYQPIWEKETQAAIAHCRPLAVAALAQQVSALSETLGAKLLPDSEAPSPELRQLRGNWAVGAALAMALSQAGWAADVAPGEPVMLRGPAGALDPFGTVHALASGELGAEAWAEQCGQLGIGELEVFGAAPVARPVASVAVQPRREAVPAAAPAPVTAVSGPAPRTRRCWRCKEPVELPAESGGERPRCAKCGTLQWVPA